jgi:enolase-phosphatase E1
MDIEGTIADIAFVKNVLFPYSARELRNFVSKNKTNPKVRQCLSDAALAEPAVQGDELVISRLLEWIEKDIKHPALKTLQGLIWRQGFEQNIFRAHLYPDVLPQWQIWQRQGLRLGIYSSGSIDAQNLFFEYSVEGDVRHFLEANFDLETGSKKDRTSYTMIAQKLQLSPSEILFLSDAPSELEAARAAGLQTALVAREISNELNPEPAALARLSDLQISKAPSNGFIEHSNIKHLLLLQFLSVPLVLSFFKFLSPPKVAALFAGALFVIFGSIGLFRTFRHGSLKKNLLFWLFAVHVFIISLPMMLVRLANWSAEFSSLTIWGLPAPAFHGLSSVLYLIIFAALGFRYWRTKP